MQELKRQKRDSLDEDLRRMGMYGWRRLVKDQEERRLVAGRPRPRGRHNAKDVCVYLSIILKRKIIIKV